MKLRLSIIGPVVAAAVVAGSVLAHTPQRGEAAALADAVQVASRSPADRLPVARRVRLCHQGAAPPARVHRHVHQPVRQDR